jgi:hypothetical protein
MRAAPRLALVLALTFAGTAGADPAAPDPGAATPEALRDAGFRERLAQAERDVGAARMRVTEAEVALRRARHRNYPRGEALVALETALVEAREKQATAEAALPELLEEARRAGVSPAVLRDFEDEGD